MSEEPEDVAEEAAAEPVDDEQQAWPAPEGVLDPTLFQLTMSAVMMMDTLAVMHLTQEGYKYVPFRESRKVTTYKESGWPNIGLKSKDESAVAFGSLFASTKNAIHPFQYDELRPMRELEDYVRGSEVLMERLHDPLDDALSDGGEFADLMLKHRIYSLPASIFDRARALGLEMEDSAVGELYLERERSWLAPELPYQYVVPLVVTAFDVEPEEEVVIDERTRIVRLSEDELRRMAQSYETAGVPGPLADAAWWALEIDMPPMENPGEGPRMYVADPVDERVINAACDAIRVVSAVKTGWARVFRRPLGWATSWEDGLPNLTHLYTARRYPAEFDDRAWLKASRPVSAEATAQLPEAAAALKTASAPTLLAMRRLSMALVRDAPDDQLIDACIGLEALLGQVDAELSYRIALRAAALLATKPTEPRNPTNVFTMARSIYNRRSELVHGSTKDKNAVFTAENGTVFAMHHVATFLLREVLHERLLRPDWTVQELDAHTLASMSPTAPVEPEGDEDEPAADEEK